MDMILGHLILPECHQLDAEACFNVRHGLAPTNYAGPGGSFAVKRYGCYHLKALQTSIAGNYHEQPWVDVT